ncbi:MAG TPA: hypothetical protein VGN00_29090 [Puia sp.]
MGLVVEDAFFIDVLDRDVPFQEGFANELAAVAVLWFAFAAHQGDADAFFVGGDDPFEAVEEEGPDADEIIVQLAEAVVAGRIGGAAAESIAHVDVAEACCAQGGDEFGLAVLGVEGGVGDGADVDEKLNGVLLQQVEEGWERTGAVADGEDHGIKLRNLANVC